jgi:hypothetical protein
MPSGGLALPDPVRAIQTLRDKSALICTDRAKLGLAMRSLYRDAGFAAVVAATHGELQALATLVQEEGGDLQGWAP